ncbi:hypothetical protein BP6252_13256 [Coleophoma cylindrospora]|uniref:Uncharacterized protein n=1 Tax=Coleophoma cylindrospora TaxID=1849047 RepID=A0A3D8QAV9_9HELO|nr:hypothetical protein BP6252_13256 [Coleophoma cylindrospora]
MKAKKTYFIVAPGSSSAVGPIALGNVISDPALPDSAINPQPIVFPPSVTISNGIPLKNWKWSKSPSTQIDGGIYAQFVDVVDGEIRAHREKETTLEYSCQELRTQSFQINEEYIEAIKAVPAIQAKVLRRERLYVITGIKIATGATVNEQTLKSLGFRLAAMVDLTAVTAVPVKVGPQFEFNKKDPESLNYDVDDAFVFAYRLEEIFYRWRSMRHRPFGKEGDLHGLPDQDQDSDSEDEDGDDTIDNFVFDKPQDHDLVSVEEGQELGKVKDDDGVEYEVVLMKR